MPWDPEQYERFRRERAAPFADLVRLLRVRPGLRVVDLGCGTGELTERLAALLPDSDVTGIDSSAQMLAQAHPRARPGLRFEAGRLEEVDGDWDVVFSHAAIQWVDDHEALVPRLFGLVRPGGQLAVQLPSNHGHPTHLILEELARGALGDELGGWARHSPVLPVDGYAQRLYDAGGTQLTVLEKVYCHLLPCAADLVEWMKGTALVPYLERLPEDRHEAFLAAYGRRLRQHYGAPDGEILFPFRRILFAATRPREAGRWPRRPDS